MPDSTKKKLLSSQNKEIVALLRKAVLEQIGDMNERNLALKKIQKENLPRELKDIGEKLVQRKITVNHNAAKKDSEVKLTAKEIALLRKISETSSPKQQVNISRSKQIHAIEPSPQQPMKKEIQNIPQKVQTKGREIKKVKPAKLKKITEPDHLLRGGTPQPVHKLLPPPSFFERIRSIFTTGRFLLILLVLFLMMGGGGLYFVYKTDWNNKTVEKVVTVLRLPAALVNGEPVMIVDYVQDVRALDKFYNTQKDLGGIAIPSIEEIKKNVLERHVRIILTKQTLLRYNQPITKEETEIQFTELMKAAGGEQELGKILYELYGWSIDEFMVKALVPLLTEEKLAVLISQDNELNSDKEALIHEIKITLNEGADFAEIAGNFSQDVTASQGGDLDWFSRGDMVKEFEDHALILEIEEISEPFKTVFGWHIVKLTDKDEQAGKFKVSHILIKYLTVDEYIERLTNEADIKIFIDVKL